MYRALYSFVKRKIPKISGTEMIALQCGDTSIERDILEGRVSFPRPQVFEEKFNHVHVSELLSSFDDSRIYPNQNENDMNINFLNCLITILT